MYFLFIIIFFVCGYVGMWVHICEDQGPLSTFMLA